MYLIFAKGILIEDKKSMYFLLQRKKFLETLKLIQKSLINSLYIRSKEMIY